MGRPIYLPEYRESWALLIGIDDYPYPIAPLHSAVKGVGTLAHVLETQLGFPADHIRTLTNEQAYKRAIEKEFDLLSRKDRVGPDDRVLVYFAGHGDTFDTPYGEVGCIIPYDAEPGFESTALSMNHLVEKSTGIWAKHILFLLDCCFSGYAAIREADTFRRHELADLLANASRQVITAGLRHQTSSDGDGPEGHSLFTGFLLRGLQGEANSQDDFLDITHLFSYVRRQVSSHPRSRQTPQLGVLHGSAGGDFVFQVTKQLSNDETDKTVKAVGQVAAQELPSAPDSWVEQVISPTASYDTLTDQELPSSTDDVSAEWVVEPTATHVDLAEQEMPQIGEAVNIVTPAPSTSPFRNRKLMWLAGAVAIVAACWSASGIASNWVVTEMLATATSEATPTDQATPTTTLTWTPGGSPVTLSSASTLLPTVGTPNLAATLTFSALQARAWLNLTATANAFNTSTAMAKPPTPTPTRTLAPVLQPTATTYFGQGWSEEYCPAGWYYSIGGKECKTQGGHTDTEEECAAVCAAIYPGAGHFWWPQFDGQCDCRLPPFKEFPTASP